MRFVNAAGKPRHPQPLRDTARGTTSLPLEGDRTLAVILSKALMLADESRIKDRTILNQIER